MRAWNWPSLIAVGGLLIFWVFESWIPAAAGRRGRMRHGARNLALGVINSGIGMLAVAGPMALSAGLAERFGFGLLRLAELPFWVSTFGAVVLFDCWMYIWHRANHRIGFLWRFHRVHHSDSEMDATSAVRFHTGEILISSALRLAVLPLLGISLWQLMAYESLMFPVILFHHSNVRLPERFDRPLRALVVTPAMHRVHHSRLRIETDSNYSTIFSIWDRLAGTYRLRSDGSPVDLGLDEFDSERWRGLGGMLAMPLAPEGADQKAV